MASRAGLSVMNLEFIQFHPTTLHSVEGDRFLITEAVRGEGAKLIDSKGRHFLEKYHPLADLAPRDVVARAIDREMKRSGAPCVRLDTPNMSVDFKDRFPNVYENCMKRGIDPTKVPIPVVPAAHYSCGGVPTGLDCSTKLSGLYACGEVACTGFARCQPLLASNSLLEAVVMAHRGAESVHVIPLQQKKRSLELPGWVDGDVPAADERVVLSHNLEELKRAMWDYVGIVRSTKRLGSTYARLRNLSREINEYYWNARGGCAFARATKPSLCGRIDSTISLTTKKAGGLHFTLDFPDQLAKPKNTRVSPVPNSPQSMSLKLGKIGLVGPGAIGGYYGGMLAHAGQDVHFLFHSTYSDVLRNGLSLVHHAEGKRTSTVEPLQAYQNADDIGHCNLVIVASKATANDSLGAIMKQLVGPETSLLTLQNGMGNVENLPNLLGGNARSLANFVYLY